MACADQESGPCSSGAESVTRRDSSSGRGRLRRAGRDEPNRQLRTKAREGLAVEVVVDTPDGKRHVVGARSTLPRRRGISQYRLVPRSRRDWTSTFASFGELCRSIARATCLIVLLRTSPLPPATLQVFSSAIRQPCAEPWTVASHLVFVASGKPRPNDRGAENPWLPLLSMHSVARDRAETCAQSERAALAGELAGGPIALAANAPRCRSPGGAATRRRRAVTARADETEEPRPPLSETENAAAVITCGRWSPSPLTTPLSST